LNQKPQSCSGCSLATLGQGFVEADGPEWSDILWVGESPGEQELEPTTIKPGGERKPRPFVGAAGQKLMSIMRRVGLDRADQRMANLCQCQPPGNVLRGASYEWDAVRHCRQYLQPVLNEPHKVVIAVGAVPTIHLTEFGRPTQTHKFNLDAWHGQPTFRNGKWIVPTFHPSYILRGYHKLTGVVCFDIIRARELASGQWKEQPATLRVDPELEWFTRWVDAFLAAISSGQEVWIALDIETVEKLTGAAEDELEGTQTQIVRINLSCNPDEGLTVPWVGPYIDQVRRIVENPKVQAIYHNYRYDVPLIQAAGLKIEHKIYDTMRMFKYVQSDLRRSLGFIAPFYSKYYNHQYNTSAWKHLSHEDEGTYAAIDAFQTLRIAHGCAKDLQKAGLWNLFQRHSYDLFNVVLHPAEAVGLGVDLPLLDAFTTDLDQKEQVLEAKIAKQVDPENRPLLPAKGWKKPKKGVEGIIEQEIAQEVLVCTDCNMREVTQRHKCKLCKTCGHPVHQHDLGWCFGGCENQSAQCDYNKKPKKPRKKKKSDAKT
jgi:uracil-DNA glycosylase family 4